MFPGLAYETPYAVQTLINRGTEKNWTGFERDCHEVETSGKHGRSVEVLNINWEREWLKSFGLTSADSCGFSVIGNSVLASRSL